MKLAHKSLIKLTLIFLSLISYFHLSWAQFDDTPPIKLDQVERQRLQAILDAEIDQGQLNTKKIEQHKRQTGVFPVCLLTSVDYSAILVLF